MSELPFILRKTVPDARATNSYARQFYSNGTARASFSGALERVRLWARADLCNGAPDAAVWVDGKRVMRPQVTTSASYSLYEAAYSTGAGVHEIAVPFPNDYSSSAGNCDRNLYVDKLAVVTTADSATPTDPPPPSTGTNPFAGEKFYVDPNSSARRTADQWYAQGRTADAQQIEKIAKKPI